MAFAAAGAPFYLEVCMPRSCARESLSTHPWKGVLKVWVPSPQKCGNSNDSQLGNDVTSNAAISIDGKGNLMVVGDMKRQ